MKKFVNIEEYMKRSREERRSHLRLDEPCIEIGTDSRICRGLLAHHLGTTVGGYKTHACHACNNPKCSNPNHLYWGTAKDNHRDQVEAGNWTNPYDRMIEKYGQAKAEELRSEYGRLGGKAGGGKNKLKPHQIVERTQLILESRPTEYGWVARASKLTGTSHTQVRRFVKEYMPDLQYYRRQMKE